MCASVSTPWSHTLFENTRTSAPGMRSSAMTSASWPWIASRRRPASTCERFCSIHHRARRRWNGSSGAVELCDTARSSPQSSSPLPCWFPGPEARIRRLSSSRRRRTRRLTWRSIHSCRLGWTRRARAPPRASHARPECPDASGRERPRRSDTTPPESIVQHGLAARCRGRRQQARPHLTWWLCLRHRRASRCRIPVRRR